METIKVLRAFDETPQLRRIVLEAGALKSAYTTPGQYLELSPGGDLKSYFAIASAPSAANFELLVKRGSAVADALAMKQAGDTVQTKPPAGRGYDLGAAKGKDVLLFAAGSGIAPIRALLTHLIENRKDYGKVVLYYGQQNPGDFAFTGEIDAWRAGRADVVRVCSKNGSDWTGPKGHVQDAFKASPPAVLEPVAFACGMKGMIAGVTEALQPLRVTKIYQNF